jgi:hypothetical protein
MTIESKFGAFLHVKQGLKKGDGTAHILVNLALEYVILKLQLTENKHVCTTAHGFIFILMTHICGVDQQNMSRKFLLP